MTARTEVADQYRQALASYLDGATEGALLQAYEIGREGLVGGLGMLDLIVLHHRVLAEFLGSGSHRETELSIRAAGVLLAEALGPFEMANRGYQDAVENMRRLNEHLEDEVRVRTQRLERSVLALRDAQRQRRELWSRLVAAQEEERRRISSDIHDDIVQVMTAVSLRLHLVERDVGTGGSGEPFRKLQGTVDEAIQRLRSLMFELRPAALDREGLAAAVRERLDRFSADTAVACALEDHLPVEPPSDVRACVYRVVHEALANIRKHAGATRVDVRLERRDDGVSASVSDDGVGFDPDAARDRSGHVGLDVMRERAELSGGWLRAESTPGSGCTVTIWVPEEGKAGTEG